MGGLDVAAQREGADEVSLESVPLLDSLVRTGRKTLVGPREVDTVDLGLGIH